MDGAWNFSQQRLVRQSQSGYGVSIFCRTAYISLYHLSIQEILFNGAALVGATPQAIRSAFLLVLCSTIFLQIT